MPTLTARFTKVQMHLASVSVGGKTIVAGPPSPKVRFSAKIWRFTETKPRPRETESPANSGLRVLDERAQSADEAHLVDGLRS